MVDGRKRISFGRCKMKIEEFEKLIWEFIQENAQCNNCAYDLPKALGKDEYVGSYRKALEELFKRMV